FARFRAVLDAEPDLEICAPTVAWARAAFQLMRLFAQPGYAARLRQPMLMLAAGQDEVVSTAAIEQFGAQLLAGSHLIIPGARHDRLQERELYRQQFWAAFDAFVPGTPYY